MDTLDMSAIRLGAVVIDTDDMTALAGFYRRFLGLDILRETADFIGLGLPEGGLRLYIQRNDLYRPPVWPEEPERPQPMMHLDFACSDLPAALAHALACGARKAPVQYLPGSVVLFDPAGHPFCLCADKAGPG